MLGIRRRNLSRTQYCVPGLQMNDHAAALIALMVGWILVTPAMGQDECLATYSVNTTKSVTYLAIGPSADDRINTAMSCSIADAVRDKLFETRQTFDPNVLADASQLRTKILEIRMRLADGKSELQTAESEATRSGAILTLKDAVLAAGVASAVTGCIVSTATCKPAVGASVALYGSRLASNVGEFEGPTQVSAETQKEINIFDSMLQSIQAQINDNVAQQSKLRFGSVIAAICTAIRQQCR